LDENVLTGKVVALFKGIWCQVEASRESGTRYSAVFPERSAKLQGVTAGPIKASSLRVRRRLADLVDVKMRNF
jgi:hypothetical protein